VKPRCGPAVEREAEPSRVLCNHNYFRDLDYGLELLEILVKTHTVCIESNSKSDVQQHAPLSLLLDALVQRSKSPIPPSQLFGIFLLRGLVITSLSSGGLLSKTHHNLHPRLHGVILHRSDAFSISLSLLYLYHYPI